MTERRTLCEQLMDLEHDISIHKKNLDTARELGFEPRIINESQEKYELMLSDYDNMVNSIVTYYKLKREDYEIK